jgi:hypothetical protein
MPRSFSAKNILLGSGLLSATGNSLYLNAIAVNGSASGVASLNSATGNINLTGAGNVTVSVNNQVITFSGDTGVYANFATTANLALTGQAAWTAAQNNAINLSGNLTQTGIALINLITAASAGVSSLNNASGVVSIVGAGNVSVTTSGQTITVSGNEANTSNNNYVYLTGSQIVTGLKSFNSGVIISGNGADFSIGGFVPSWQEGRVFYDSTEHTLAYYNDANGVTVNVGQESLIRVANRNSSTIPNGSVVYISGAQGNRPIAQLPIASSPSADKSVGVATMDIGGMQNGYVTTFGLVHDLNLSAFQEGDLVYLSSITSGGFQNTPPNAPDRVIKVGTVINNSASVGILFVNVVPVHENLKDLNDVFISTGALLNGDLLSYNSTSGLWLRSPNFSGVLDTKIASTGQAAWTAAQNNAVNLSGNLTSTGSTLDGKINSLSGFIGNVSGGLETRIFQTGAANITYSNSIGVSVSGSIATTGQQAINYANSIGVSTSGTIALTGQAAWTAANNNALNLSGNLQLTGSNLQTQINNIAGGTGNILTNVVFTTGAQYIVGTKYFIGNTYIDNLFVTGSQTVINTQDLYIADNWITLNATGGARDSAIFISTGFTGISATGGVLGFDVPSSTWRFGLGSQQTDLVNLPSIASGEAVTAVDSKVNSLSGFTTNLSGAINTILIATGNAAISHANGIGSILSGNLTQTGVNLGSKIDSLSGFVGNVSGGLETRIFQTGAANITYSNSIGVSTSGTIATTGQQAVNYANSIGASASGTIASTGSAAVIHANGIGIIISGNLTQTGVNLGSKIDSLSGYSNNIFVQTGTILTYATGIVTGSDQVYINHLNHVFSTIPKVVAELETTNQNYMYYHIISGRSTTGFYLLFSDIIAETGLYANIIAKS